MKNLIAATLLMLGMIFFSLNEVRAEDDPDVAKYKALCEKGNGTSCFKIGERYRVVEIDKKSATVYHLKACDHGYITGCTHAGILIQMTGKQYSPQWKQAATLFTKGCDVNSDKACFNLGQLKYKEGRQKAALKYWGKACDLGNQVACANNKRLKD